MPQLPPWIGAAPNYPALYLSAYGQGASVAQEQARMALAARQQEIADARAQIEDQFKMAALATSLAHQQEQERLAREQAAREEKALQQQITYQGGALGLQARAIQTAEERQAAQSRYYEALSKSLGYRYGPDNNTIQEIGGYKFIKRNGQLFQLNEPKLDPTLYRYTEPERLEVLALQKEKAALDKQVAGWAPFANEKHPEMQAFVENAQGRLSAIDARVKSLQASAETRMRERGQLLPPPFTAGAYVPTNVVSTPTVNRVPQLQAPTAALPAVAPVAAIPPAPPDPKDRKVGALYVWRNGQVALWATDASGAAGWIPMTEPTNAPLVPPPGMMPPDYFNPDALINYP